MDTLPSLFVSHGSPMLALEDGPARSFLMQLGQTLGRPRAVVVFSAHWEAPGPLVTAAPRPETIHDFYGFPAALHAMRYPAPGDPVLAGEMARRLQEAGLPAGLDAARGLDHGAWVPLSLMFPKADVPVVQVSIDPGLGPAYHLRLGEAMRPLRSDGILVVGSGSATHNLRELHRGDPGAAPPVWVTDFAEWLSAAVEAGDADALLAWRETAPHALRNHPTDEHLLPLFCALGARTAGQAGRRLHTSHTYGALAMDVYAFD